MGRIIYEELLHDYRRSFEPLNEWKEAEQAEQAEEEVELRRPGAKRGAKSYGCRLNGLSLWSRSEAFHTTHDP